MKKKYMITSFILIIVFFGSIIIYNNYINELLYIPKVLSIKTTDVETDNNKTNTEEEVTDDIIKKSKKKNTTTTTNDNNNVQQNNGSSNTTSSVKERIRQVRLVNAGGWIHINGNDLVDQNNNLIQLKGVSSNGLQWYSSLINRENLRILRDEWKTNVVRLAMYTEDDGYISNPNLINTLMEKMDLIISMNMYIIVDWNNSKDGDPNKHIESAKEFFNTISSKYKNSPNVIYEICNEPNGGNIHWDTHIKPYADEIVRVIRNNTKSLIIVGTESYSKSIVPPLYNKINDNNVMYSLHFSAGNDTDSLREKMKTARSNGLPIIISKFVISRDNDTGGIFPNETDKWIKLLDEYNISYINWSLANKNNSSSLLKAGKTTLTDDNLSQAGIYIKK